MLDTSNVFLTGIALEALSEWSATLKAFQQKLGKHFARKYAKQRSTIFMLFQALSIAAAIKTGALGCRCSMCRN
jgi:hypothetical protein